MAYSMMLMQAILSLVARRFVWFRGKVPAFRYRLVVLRHVGVFFNLIEETSMSCLSRLNRTLLVLALASSFAHAGETTNRIGITMVDIPAGSFLMGSCKVPSDVASRNAEENKKRAFLGQAPVSVALDCTGQDSEAYDDETPQHRVSIRAFQMSKTEVTLGQFKQFIAAAGRTDLLSDDFMRYNAYGDDAPVVWVSWHDAQAFIKWLNKVDGGGYRLPSEAEWEYACRAGGQHTYCGGNDLNALGWYSGNSGGHQRPVGGKRANAFGLFDMSGNAYEWVQDCWHDNYNGAPTDGSAWTSGKCEERVMRGGFSYSYIRNTRAAIRNHFRPDDRASYYGFRLARTR